eukprot:12256584-Karenia_brevis.AAC.1
MVVCPQQAFFHTHYRCANRMSAFGYTDRLQHTAVVPLLSSTSQQMLNLACLTLHGNLTHQQRAALADDALWIRTQRFTGHGNLRCSDALRRLSATFSSTNVVAIFPSCRIYDAPLTCPEGHVRCDVSKFDPTQVHKAIWCSMCQKAHTAARWTCECGILWQHCRSHFVAPRMQAAPRARARVRPAPFHPDEAARKLRRLEDRPISLKLGSVLASRFPHLAHH